MKRKESISGLAQAFKERLCDRDLKDILDIAKEALAVGSIEEEGSPSDKCLKAFIRGLKQQKE